jgi:hypothetical protein
MKKTRLFHLYLNFVSNYFPTRSIIEASLLNKTVDHIHQILFKLNSVREIFFHGYGYIILLVRAAYSFVAGMSNQLVSAARNELRGLSLGRQILKINRKT